MSNKPYKGFEPKWLLTPAPEGSYRSIFRWGDPEFFKYPKESLYKMMKETFHMTDADFQDYTDDIGFDRVELDVWEFNEAARQCYEAAGFCTYRRYMEMKP